MGMPVRVDVRDGGVRPGAVERVFAWLRVVDATFSTYRADSEISRLGRGELRARDAHPLVAEVLERCERAPARDRRLLRRRARAARSTRRAT